MRRYLILLAIVACGDGPTQPLIRLHDETPNRLSVGVTSTCVMALEKLHCWGLNGTMWEFGLPQATLNMSYLPVAVAEPTFVSITTGGGGHRCGISATGLGICWGRGSHGQLGGGEVAALGNEAVEVDGFLPWKRISTGRITTCGLTTAGVAYCWGTNQNGEIGNIGVDFGVLSAAPVRVEGGHTFVDVSAGWMHACGLTAEGAAFCWGENQYGQLGTGTAGERQRSPQPVAGGHHFVQLSAGFRHTCGITTEKRAFCWGLNSVGQLGDGTTETRSAPTPVSGNHSFVRIVTGFGGDGTSAPLPQGIPQGGVAHTCALTERGRAYCWGWNAAGQLGDGSMVDRHVPTAVQSDERFTSIGVGGSHTCGMRDERVWCWGSSLWGQVGDGSGGVGAMTFSPRLAYPSTPGL